MNRELFIPLILIFLLTSATVIFSQQAENVELVGRALYSAAYSVFVQDSYAYVGTYGSVLVFDISDPSYPLLTGHVYTKGVIRRLWVSGKYAYSAQEKDGFYVYDVSDPHNPREIAHPEIEHWARSIFVCDTLAFVAHGQHGLLIFDVSDPLNPEVLSSFDTPGSAMDCFVSDTLLYVVDGGLTIMNISDPSHPREVGFYRLNAQSLWVSDTLAYVGTGGSLRIIEVSNPYEPKSVSNTLIDSGVSQITVSNGIAYLAGDEGGLLIFDVSDPYQPRQRATFETQGRAFGLALVSTNAYVADAWGGLLIFDVSNPSDPILSGSYVTGHSVENMYVTDGFLYVAEYYAGLRILDVSDPSHPVVVGSFGAGELICGIQVQGRYAYLADNWLGLRIVDISDPTRPEQVGVWESPAIMSTDLFVSDSLVYFINYFGGLWIIDVSNPFVPTSVGHFSGTSFTNDICVQDSIAYLADYGGLRIVNVSDPAHPQQIGIFESEIEVGVYVSGTSAYISGGDSGLDYYRFRIVDVSDPANPFQKGYCCHDTRPYSVYVCDSLAYVADYMFGLQVIRVNHPPMLDRIGFYQTDSFVLSTFCADGYAYLGGPEGLYIFNYQRKVGVSDEWATTKPETHVLNQNWPNPFNPITYIRYQIPENRSPVHTTLKIYNILGQELRTLVNEPQEAGYYEVTWDGRDNLGREVASDVYLYRLEAGDFVRTKKMTLIR